MIKAENGTVELYGLGDEELFEDMTQINAAFITWLKSKGHSEQAAEMLMVRLIAKGFEEKGEILRIETGDE